ncbi:MAG TPA: UDP-N-acetylglucosamine--N-acetylmuramyl-(pentapeptide) pyrophosphoryl-undecaprenol N-acetylglucosamine transferase, partial [Polyangiaceae bacterium]|nr:UDP-N-acetylglucosamine--N-acetylmuramyl-(pentapeptide) pyrophosphoryl-undecaprenol N-acetylglucosamine transferase [Polyangiaceae bacterium]
AALAALAARVPLAIVEPNAVPGFTHRLLGPFARRAYVAWDEVAERFPEGRARVFGVPLGRAFAPSTYHTRERRRVLVLGGSLGAQALNERVPLALGKVHRDLGGVEVVHQTGTGREAEVRGLYDRAGVAGARCVPFLDDVAGELADADLVVARAGAVTVAELACVGRASLLVPFPYAADDHQLKNATLYQRRGACRVVEQERATVDRLAADIRLVLSDDGLRERMARAAAKAGRPDAALEIACDLVELGGLKMRNVAGDDLRGSRGRRTEVH